MAQHAIKAEASANDAFPTRRQLRDAAAVVELQKQLTEPRPDEATPGSPSYAMGPAVSATQKPQASFSIEQFRTAATQSPTENVTKAAAELTKSPAISTAAAASLTGAPARPVVQTLPPVTATTPASAFEQTHTFTPVARAATAASAEPAAAPSAAPASVAPASAPASAPLSAPVTASTSTMPSMVPTSIVPRQEPADSSSAPAFVPVMRTGTTAPPATIPDDIEYRPFDMTPRITTGKVEAPTHVNTVSVWLLTLMPTFLLGAVVALSVLAPEFYTPFTLGGLIFVFAIGSLALAISDRRQLVQRDHQTTASPAWALLTPLAYLVARAVRTRQQAGRGWMPAIAFILLSLGGAAAVVLTPITLTAFAASL